MHIFVAFPFTQFCNSKTGLVSNEYITFLENLRKTLINTGHDVFLAHYREKWGKNLMGPEECTPADLEEMKKTDIVLAFPGWPISGGVHVELGWASALGKSIVLFLEEKKDYSPLILGLPFVTKARLVYYDELNYEKLLPVILKGMREIENEKSA